MRLADFILNNVEPILVEWEAFARTIWPGGAKDPATLRDHAGELLHATAVDMKSAQTAAEQAEKSKGLEKDGNVRGIVDAAAVLHAVERAGAGFTLPTVVSEYRALRASVQRLWRAGVRDSDPHDLDDLTRFNESIDQSMTEAIRGFTAHVDLIAGRLASIVESSDDAIISKSLDGIITS